MFVVPKLALFCSMHCVLPSCVSSVICSQVFYVETPYNGVDCWPNIRSGLLLIIASISTAVKRAIQSI